jgi:hypothetical protein
MSPKPEQHPARKFLILYFTHILTTAVLPIALYVFGIIDPAQTLVMIVAFAGFWTLVGVVFIKSQDSRHLRKFYFVFGIIFVVVAVLVYLLSLA